MALTEDAVIARLASSRDTDGARYLEPHHLLAAGRLGKLIERSRLMARVTMSYDAARVGGGRGSANAATDASDTASAARQKLNQLAGTLPADCWNVLFDVVGFGKGLQTIETERRWPRRSAKLVLRIGLEQLATFYGLTAIAKGAEQRRPAAWLEARLPLIAEASAPPEPGSECD